jgi:hypothetical protein
MEYLHMQQPIDGIYHNVTVTGVPVSIDAVDPNNNYVHIGDTISDETGTFGYTWTPTFAGQYKITASFAGDASYGSSWADAYATVTQAPSASATPAQVQAAADYTMTIIASAIGIAIVVVISVALATVLILRKRP